MSKAEWEGGNGCKVVVGQAVPGVAGDRLPDDGVLC